jgi:ADP-ribose pyrophosphatase
MAIIYKGRVFSIDVDTVKLANGRDFQLEVVRHPPSVVLLPIDDRGRVILIRQYRHPIGRDLWELPAGSLDEGESAEAAAARECEEEIAYRPSTIEKLGALYPTPGYCDELMVFFRVSGLRPPPPDSPHAPDEDEDIQAQPFTVAEARAMVARGDIVDMKTAYALTLI